MLPPGQKAPRLREDMEAVRTAIRDVLKADHPQTVRQVFYQLVVRDVIEKTEGEYKRTVIRLLAQMQLDDQIPWAWIVDESRTTKITQTFDNISEALQETASFYRRSALRESDVYLEVWCEKQALAGIIYEAASDYDVPVIVSKGMPSLTQVHDSFARIHGAARAGKSSFIYQFGDHDPTGCLIRKVYNPNSWNFARRGRTPILPVVERIALTEEQIEEHELPSRPTKRDSNPHAKDFEGDSVELDALPSAVLRELVTECISQHISDQELETLRAAEESEREVLLQLSADYEDEAANDGGRES